MSYGCSFSISILTGMYRFTDVLLTAFLSLKTLHNKTKMYLILLPLYLFITADISLHKVRDQFTLAKQHKSMQKALFLPENIANDADGGISRYLLAPHSAPEDCCSWRGVECTDGIATSFILTTYDEKRRRWSLSLPWLPQTLQYVYTKFPVIENKFTIEDLSRETRYFYMHGASCKESSLNDTFNLANLPAKIEEFRVRIDNVLHGTVYIPTLPETLEICSLFGTDIQLAVVDNSALPQDLKKITLRGGGLKVRTVDGSKVDNRIEFRPGGKRGFVQSKYSHAYIDKCLDIEDEIEMLAQRIDLEDY